MGAKNYPLRALGTLIENFDGRRIPVKESERKPGPYPYYGASGVVDYIDNYIFEGDYLLVSEDGENLRTRQTPIAFMAKGKFWVNNHAHIIRGNEHADTRYLCYVLSSTDISGYLTGSTMPKLTQGNLNILPVIAPPLSEQKRIAGILGTLDDKIELNRKMNETLEELVRALFKSWFIDYDPVHAKAAGRGPAGMDQATADLFPVSFEGSELGKIPKGWKTSTVGQKLTTILGGTPSRTKPEYWTNGTVAWINSGKANEFRITDPSEWITEEALENSATKLLPKRTTVLAITGATLGQVSVTEIECCANQSVIGIISSNQFPTEYIYPWINEKIGTLIASQTGGAQQHVNKRNVEDLPLLCPDAKIVQSYAAITKPIFDKIADNCFQSRTLAALRDTLIPKLLSGEIPFPDQP